MKNTIAGAIFVIASVVCVVMIANLVSVAMLSNMVSINGGVYIFGVGFLLLAGFVYLCFAVYYFNAEDKPSP